MRKTVRLTESDLSRIVRRVILEQDSTGTEAPPSNEFCSQNAEFKVCTIKEDESIYIGLYDKQGKLLMKSPRGYDFNETKSDFENMINVSIRSDKRPPFTEIRTKLEEFKKSMIDEKFPKPVEPK